MKSKCVLFNDMSLGTKLFIGFFIIIAEVCIASIPLAKHVFVIDRQAANIHMFEQGMSLAYKIQWLDEVRSQAIRNYIFTSDQKWRDRYDYYKTKLADVVSSARTGTNENDVQEILSKYFQAQAEIDKLEMQSLDLLKNGEKTDALAILESPVFVTWKDFYTNTINQHLHYLTVHLESLQHTHLASMKNFMNLSGLMLLIIILSSICIALYFSLHITRTLRALTEAIDRVGRGDFTKRIPVTSGDEIGQLSVTFNKMALAMERVQNGALSKQLAELTKQIQK